MEGVSFFLIFISILKMGSIGAVKLEDLVYLVLGKVSRRVDLALLGLEGPFCNCVLFTRYPLGSE